ncbi:MAG: hypothetical protein M1821_006661 [Bathelium mastoideum]|nr:MAG: hypothetical protein M1821_006661 [Bathelium mastoideum]
MGSPALRFSNYYPFQAPRNEIDDLCNMQVSKASDIDDADVKTCLSMLRIFANYLDSSQFKVVRDRLFPSYDSIPIVWRLAFSRSLNALATADRAAVFRHVITHDGSISKETLDLSVEKRMSLLHTALFYYGASRERFPQDDRDRWEALLYHFVRYSEDLNGVDTWQSWPILDYIFSDTICTDREKLQWTATPLMSLIKGAVLTDYILRLNTFQVTADRAVKAWLGILSYSGIDLERYGQREKQVFLVDVLNVKEHMACCGTYPLSDWGLGFINPSYNINCSYWANGPESHRPADGSEENVSPPLRLANFTYGPRPEDWQLRFEWCEEEWFGTFWDTVEHSDENQWNTFPVPGQWAE